MSNGILRALLFLSVALALATPSSAFWPFSSDSDQVQLTKSACFYPLGKLWYYYFLRACDHQELEDDGVYAWEYPAGTEARFVGYYYGNPANQERIEHPELEDDSRKPLIFAEVELHGCTNVPASWTSSAAKDAFGVCDFFPGRYAVLGWDEVKTQSSTAP